jgi:hypothetical protein
MRSHVTSRLQQQLRLTRARCAPDAKQGPVLEQYKLLVTRQAAAKESHLASTAGGQQVPQPSRKECIRFVGLATDGGCDRPISHYWVDRVFRASSRSMYCSSAKSANVNCIGLLQVRPGGMVEGQSGTHVATRRACMCARLA